jgi:DNA-binding NtrC family response regulator
MTENAKHLLLVDDEAALREAIAERLSDHGFVVEQAASGEDARTRLAEFAFDIIVTDLRLPGVDGRAVLEFALERYPEIIAIIITGFGTVKDAVNAIKQGAADFITKPFQFDALLHVLNSALEQRRLRSENAYLRSQLEERYRIDGLVGRSRAMRDLSQLLETVAATASTVLITGETGTGKELAARAIHHASPRRANRFVAINCSAIPETLLEAELFGHARGAFTGAAGARAGLIEHANGGTLFLDEIGTMAAAVQAKLLRALEAGEVRRIGENDPRRVDVRFVAATNSDLQSAVDAGTFRNDLFYRLNVHRIHLPPLRERPGDIEELVDFFLHRVGPPAGVTSVSAPARVALLGYDYPGNVRQLEHVIQRAVAVARGPVVEPSDLPEELFAARAADPQSAAADGTVAAARERAEREMIVATLARNHGEVSATARELQVSRTTLWRLMKKHQI